VTNGFHFTVRTRRRVVVMMMIRSKYQVSKGVVGGVVTPQEELDEGANEGGWDVSEDGGRGGEVGGRVNRENQSGLSSYI